MAQENELVKRIQAGDAAAFEALIALYYPAIFRYCRWHTPTRQAAEDATQESFLRLFAGFDRYTHRGKLRAYLYRIAHNICVDAARRPGELPLEDAGALLCEPPELARAEADADFARLAQALPAPQREVVLLRFGHDLTLRQTAEVLGLPLRTVQSRQQAALKRLRAGLDDRGGGEDG